MANTVSLEFRVTDKGTLKLVGQSAEKAAGSVSKVGKSSAEADRNIKGVAHASSNATKNFSKMSQGMQSFLVPAYAELAARLFAATAAFNALQRAAQVEQLTQGLAAMGAQSGIAMKTLSNGLKEVTGFAISTEEAMRSTAQVISAGFGEAELLRIGKVAKNASIALGRDLQDSMSRLTRGVIKLEPELLDEIGIMVRLDEATERYKEQLNIVGRELTLTEKRQAFMNAVLAEGENKFAAIGEKVDVNPYNKLAASLADLSQSILSFISGYLEPFLAKLTELPLLITAVAGVLIKSIVGNLVPGFASMAAAAAAASDRVAQELSNKFGDAVVALEDTSSALLKLDKSFSSPTSKAFFAELKDGFQGNAEEVTKLGKAIDSNAKQISNLEKAGRQLTDTEKKKLVVLKQERALMLELKTLHKSTGQAQFETTAQQVQAYQRKQAIYAAEANALNRIEEANVGLVGSLRSLRVAFVEAWKLGVMQFRAGIEAARASVLNFNIGIKALFISLGGILGAFKGLASAAKLLGLALLQALPLIGQVIAIGTLAYDFLKGFFTSEEEEKRTEKIEAINEALRENYRILSDIAQVSIETNKDITDALIARATAIQAVIKKLEEMKRAEARGQADLPTGRTSALTSYFQGNGFTTLEAIRRGEVAMGARLAGTSATLTPEIEALANILQDDYSEALFIAEAGTANFNQGIQKLQKEGRLGEVIQSIADGTIQMGNAARSLRESVAAASEAFARFRNKFTTTTPFDETFAAMSNVSEATEDLFSQIDQPGGVTAVMASLQTELSKLGRIELRRLGLEEFVNKPTEDMLPKVRQILKDETGRLAILQKQVRESKQRLNLAKMEQKSLSEAQITAENANEILLERQQINARIFAEEQIQRSIELAQLQDVEEKKLKQAEISQASIQFLLDRNKEIYSVEQQRIGAMQELSAYEEKIANSRKEQLDSSIQILRNQIELANLADPNRTTGALTAEQELAVFEMTKKLRMDAALEQYTLQQSAIDLEYDLLDAKYKFLRANLDVINAERTSKGLAPISISALENVESRINAARNAATEAAGAAFNATISNIGLEGEQLKTAAQRVIPNLQQPARMAQAGLDIEAQRGANLTGEAKAEFDRQIQYRAAIIEKERILAEMREKGRQLAIAGSAQERQDIANEIELLAQKGAQQNVIIQQAEDNLNNIKRIGLQLGESLSGGLEGALNSIAEGTKSVKQAFGDMAIGILQDIQKMIIKMLIMKAIQASLSFIPGGAAVGGFLGFAKEGGIMTSEGKVPGYAVGGIAQGPTQGYPAILHGTEAVVPLPNGKSIPVEMRDSATNNVTVNVSVDNNGNAQTQTQMDNQQAGNLGKVISLAVQEELQRQKRPGGILSPYGAA
jgi:hypothetical protein